MAGRWKGGGLRASGAGGRARRSRSPRARSFRCCDYRALREQGAIWQHELLSSLSVKKPLL